jgi:hypothetical protein
MKRGLMMHSISGSTINQIKMFLENGDDRIVNLSEYGSDYINPISANLDKIGMSIGLFFEHRSLIARLAKYDRSFANSAIFVHVTGKYFEGFNNTMINLIKLWTNKNYNVLIAKTDKNTIVFFAEKKE